MKLNPRTIATIAGMEGSQVKHCFSAMNREMKSTAGKMRNSFESYAGK